jgi:hypothetical protein
MIKEDVARTLAILRQMAEGKVLHVGINQSQHLVLTDDMQIAMKMEKRVGDEITDILIPLDMNLFHFNNYLNLYDIGMVIPDSRRYK